jgi:hypothetical protein
VPTSQEAETRVTSGYAPSVKRIVNVGGLHSGVTEFRRPEMWFFSILKILSIYILGKFFVDVYKNIL